jgi:hypothetical protein
MALTKVSRGLLSTGIVDNSNATAITLNADESATFAGNVGIGTSSPSSYFPGATNLVIAGSGDSGLTVASGTSSMARLLFADGTSGDDRYRGYIAYSHASNSMSFATDATERMRILPDGSVGIGTGVAPGTNGKGLAIFDALYPRLTFRNNTTGDSTASTVGTAAYLVGDNFYLNNQEAGILSFGTAGSERFRVDASGNLYLGKTAAGFNVDGITMFSTGQTNMTAQSAPLSINRRGSSGSAIDFYINGGLVGSVAVTTGSTSFNTSSDYRLKENVVAMSGATERLKQLNPSRFNFIADADTTVDGFLAHEVQDVVPEAITGTKDAMMDEEYEVTPAVLDDDGNVTTEAVMGTRSVPDYQGIDQSKLVPLLVATIQELEARLTALENN